MSLECWFEAACTIFPQCKSMRWCLILAVLSFPGLHFLLGPRPFLSTFVHFPFPCHVSYLSPELLSSKLLHPWLVHSHNFGLHSRNENRLTILVSFLQTALKSSIIMKERHCISFSIRIRANVILFTSQLSIILSIQHLKSSKLRCMCASISLFLDTLFILLYTCCGRGEGCYCWNQFHPRVENFN